MSADWPHTERGKPADVRTADALERIATVLERYVTPPLDEHYASRLVEATLRSLSERDVKEVR